MTKNIAVAIVGVVVWSLSVSGQEADLNSRITSMAALPASNADYRLGPGDLIEIRVFGVAQLDQTLRISATGTIKLPIVDQISAAGLSAAELERRIAERLHGDVVKDPQVSVFVKEYRSQPVTVLGAVRNPGQFQITLQLRLVDILSLAGGLQPNAGDEAMIQRPSPNGTGDEIVKIDLRELLEKGDLRLNMAMRGGDVIHVRAREDKFVYVVGELNRPGAFAVPPKREMRVSEVFALAGGASKTAKANESSLIRYDAQGQRQDVMVNFTEILKGKQEDFFVRGEDIIFVPGSKVKTFANTLLAGLPGSLATLPYRIP
jgi:polysaccharide export outer membrane protein